MSAITIERSVLPVPLLDLRAQHAAIEDELFQAIRAVYDSQKFILGPHVALLEERVAALLGKEASLFFPSGVMANQNASMKCVSIHRGSGYCAKNSTLST